MIDVNEETGRFLAQVMYEELEKIAFKSSVQGLRSLDDLVRQGTDLTQSLKRQPGFVGGFRQSPFGASGIKAGVGAVRTRKSLLKSRSAIFDDLNDYETVARSLIASSDPKKKARGSEMLSEVARAKELIRGTRSSAKPAASAAPKPSTPPASDKPPTTQSRFNRAAEITGKGVFGLGALGAGYAGYQATKSDPYSQY